MTVATEVMICVRLWFKRLADRIHIIGDAGKHLTVAGAVKVFERHAVDLFSDVLAETVGDIHCHIGHDPALTVTQQGGNHV